MKKRVYTKKFNERGEELMDSRPLDIPIGFKRPETLAETIQRMVRNEASRVAAANDMETFEEADDFDVGDDYDPSSPWELEFDPELGKEVPKEVKAELDRSRAQFDEAVRIEKTRQVNLKKSSTVRKEGSSSKQKSKTSQDRSFDDSSDDEGE